MSYQLCFSLALGSSKAGIADLRGQLVDTSGADSGSAITTGFAEIGSGCYIWNYAAFSDGFRGGVKFYSNATPATILAFASINPEEAENVDAKISTRSSHTAADVWSAGTRTLTSFGSLVSDIWANATRTLSAFAFSVTVGTNNDKTGYALSSAGVQSIWDALTSALTTVGSIGKLLVDNVDATISSRLALGSYTAPDNTSITAIKTQTDKILFDASNYVKSTPQTNVTVATNNDKTGYELVTAYNPAKTAAQTGDAMALTSAERNSTADAVLDRANGVETGFTLRQSLRLMLSALAGKLSGAATTTVVIRDVNDTTNRLVANVNGDGNRNAVTYDVS